MTLYGVGLSIVGAAIVALLGTWLALGYSRRRALLDIPGQRRSHAIPTPRGGGVGIVLALIVVTAALLGRDLPVERGSAFGIGLFAVAAVGWIDDHRPLPALSRLCVHLAAAIIFVSQMPVREAQAVNLGLAAFKVLLLVTAINFWNFMDGINGLATTQTAWVAACVGVAFALMGQWPWAMLAAAMFGASLAFLPFNFPRARIFLGDVGSGALGFAVGALLLQAHAGQALDLWSIALIVSAFGVDASLTLLSRMWRGRRWYTAHREHLYQWLVRTGRSHARVTLTFLAWNLIIVLPLLSLSRSDAMLAPWLAVGALLLGVATWCLGKRAVLRQARQRAVG